MKELTLFLMTQKGLKVLEGLLAGFGAEVIGQVVLARDDQVENDYHADLVALCEAHGIPTVTRQNVVQIATPYCLAVSWRWLINVGEMSTLIVLHDSLLPRYRGFAPLVSMLVNGESEIGVTALFANKEYDQGDILASARTPIQYPIKIRDAIELVSGLYVQLVNQLVRRMVTGKPLEGERQDDTKATYSLWLDDDDYRVDWSLSAETIRRFVDAVGFPYRGAQTLMDGQLVRIVDCLPMPEMRIENRVCGKVIRIVDGFPLVVCGSGILKITGMRNEDAELVKISHFRTRFG